MKRIAGSELNHDNWDKEEQHEDPGRFVTAKSDVIAQRKVISARRKPASQTAGIFKSFTGFSNTTNTPLNINSSSSNNHSEKIDLNKEKHLNSLKVLNQKFLESISKNIEENPICILTPLLDDYRNHLTIIKNKYPLNVNPATDSKECIKNSIDNIDKNEVSQNFTFGVKPEEKPTPIFQLKDTSNINQSTSNTKGLFSFGSKETVPSVDNSKETNNLNSNSNSLIFDKKPAFSFSETPLFNIEKPVSSSEKPEEPKLFSFAPTKSDTKSEFSFPKPGANLFGNGNTILFNAQESIKCEDDEDYVPPAPEVREVKEIDSVYDTKCKLYFQKDKEWKERGIGNLFIKPSKTGQCQLVIRADNSLATIILNVMVNSATPMNTTKNNVSIVTKTDFIDGNAPTPLLIRVKTAEKAEELLKALKTQLS